MKSNRSILYTTRNKYVPAVRKYVPYVFKCDTITAKAVPPFRSIFNAGGLAVME